jgi:hypothetical protein
MRLAGVNGFMPYKSTAELIKHAMAGCGVDGTHRPAAPAAAAAAAAIATATFTTATFTLVPLIPPGHRQWMLLMGCARQSWTASCRPGCVCCALCTCHPVLLHSAYSIIIIARQLTHLLCKRVSL